MCGINFSRKWWNTITTRHNNFSWDPFKIAKDKSTRKKQPFSVSTFWYRQFRLANHIADVTYNIIITKLSQKFSAVIFEGRIFQKLANSFNEERGITPTESRFNYTIGILLKFGVHYILEVKGRDHRVGYNDILWQCLCTWFLNGYTDQLTSWGLHYLTQVLDQILEVKGQMRWNSMIVPVYILIKLTQVLHLKFWVR